MALYLDLDAAVSEARYGLTAFEGDLKQRRKAHPKKAADAGDLRASSATAVPFRPGRHSWRGSMEHRPVEQLRKIADVHTDNHRLLSRQERLERWSECLAAQPTRRLKSLGEIEFVSKAERHALRADNSPLTIAFEDPVLRAAGLRSDQLGEAMAFFELSEAQAHRLLCSCMNGWSMEAGATAQKVHRLAHPKHREWLTSFAIGAAIAGPALLYFIS